MKIKVTQEAYSKILNLGFLVDGLENSLGGNENPFITHFLIFSEILKRDHLELVEVLH